MAESQNIEYKTIWKDEYLKWICGFANAQGYLKSGDKMLELDEDSVSMLDNIDIAGVDLDIRPYDWEVNGDTGRTAYLQSIHVVQEIDRFKARYED